MKKITSYVTMLMFCVLALTSCINQKEIAYFQKGNQQTDTIAIAKAYTPTIQSGDILGIYVTSLNPVASSFFNPYAGAQTSSTADNAANTAAGISPQPSTQATSTPGYLVDASGNIELPLLGDIKVAGLTTIQARDLIREKLKAGYLKEPTVNVRFLNYKISVMGEVARPSVYVIPNERITLPEALSLAGDLTIYGKRTNVMVIRDVDGKKEFATVDLTKRNVYSSPYYYMHANDIIYVEPGRGRVAQTDKTYQIIPIVLSALSFIAIILNYTRK
ncbi:polysaccharide biosynthesis/export family protein [Mucilaginibacter sp. MD40]|uniref:polysaccharide biosynthesis/export family protein n=1 Tax=Mucilaginibacter sp. MD40 TaxID=2029590 RepID=UPI0018E9E13E|nr:polysaccharide biosynthesis/export family protein [Mucilaginibacter sp. MD40]